MADAVREEQRLRAALDEALRLAAQQPELDQALGDHQRRHGVHVAPLGTGISARSPRPAAATIAYSACCSGVKEPEAG